MRSRHPGIEFGFDTERRGHTPALIIQEHGNHIVRADTAAQYAALLAGPPAADGVIVTGQTAYVFTADCVPLLFYADSQDGAVAAIHAGWRGVLRGIPSAAVEALGKTNLRVIVGPCIRSCCFQVKEDFRQAFLERSKPIDRYLIARDGKVYCDLIGYLLAEELQGFKPEQIDTSASRCTVCSQPELPSFRRQGATDPRLRSWIRRV